MPPALSPFISIHQPAPRPLSSGPLHLWFSQPETLLLLISIATLGLESAPPGSISALQPGVRAAAQSFHTPVPLSQRCPSSCLLSLPLPQDQELLEFGALSYRCTCHRTWHAIDIQEKSINFQEQSGQRIGRISAHPGTRHRAGKTASVRSTSVHQGLDRPVPAPHAPYRAGIFNSTSWLRTLKPREVRCRPKDPNKWPSWNSTLPHPPKSCSCHIPELPPLIQVRSI